jgi:UDP-N-acetylmuramyl pentapeptide synthase
VVLPLLPVIAVCTDTRKRMDGALFIALCGDNFDAHDYVKQAQKMGAVALLVSKKVESSLPTLVVENTQDALSKIATWHLHKLSPHKAINNAPSIRFLVSVQTSLKVTLFM